eukprot:5434825-Alexandrium_andersonii.AAC.1
MTSTAHYPPHTLPRQQSSGCRNALGKSTVPACRVSSSTTPTFLAASGWARPLLLTNAKPWHSALVWNANPKLTWNVTSTESVPGAPTWGPK